MLTNSNKQFFLHKIGIKNRNNYYCTFCEVERETFHLFWSCRIVQFLENSKKLAYKIQNPS